MHVCEGLPLADNVLIAVFRSVLPADRLPAIVAKTPSVTEALGRAGVTDYRRAATRVTATAASATQAHYHGLADGAPLLRMVSVNVDGDGHPVEYGRTWFASERLTLTVGPE